MHNSPMPYQLGERHFYAVLLLALMMHMLGFVAWHYSPKSRVTDIPIRTLNVRLGDAEDMTEVLQMSQPAPAPVQAVNDALAAAPKPAPAPAAPVKQPSDGAKQYVREVNSTSIKKTDKGGSKGGKDAEIMSRYTQLISLWIQKFKTYPESARSQGLRGETLVRIRIDRKGTIRYYTLERSTGYQVLDDAAINMIRRANPVPAVPNDYPAGDLIEFIIPVNFSLL